jgi:hypothetical protein
MVNSIFLNILGIILFVVLLFIGMKLSKNSLKSTKIGGYVLMIIGVVGLLTDIYNLIHNIIA